MPVMAVSRSLLSASSFWVTAASWLRVRMM
jgi:hypothetical protein